MENCPNGLFIFVSLTGTNQFLKDIMQICFNIVYLIIHYSDTLEELLQSFDLMDAVHLHEMT